MRNRIIAVLAIAMLNLIPAVSASAADSEPSITFEGAGWGHGVGMSQYGAYGRAVDGQTYTEILGAYYQGTNIGILGTDTVDPGPLFTNVGYDMTETLLTVFDGPATPRNGMVVTRVTFEETPPTATLFSGDTVLIEDTTPDFDIPDGCVMTLTISGVDTVWGSGTCDLTVALTSGGAEPEHVVSATRCRRPTECTYGYGTALHLVDNASSQRFEPDRLGTFGPVFPGFDLVVETTLDEYARGISEVPFSWPMDTLKTQAVAARSYAATFALSTEHRSEGCFCDVNNSSSNQVYAGWIAGEQMADRWDSAATSTAGEVVTHTEAPDAGIVQAYYSSSNGGTTEWVKDKWGSDLPYLLSIDDPWSLVDANPLRAWTFDYMAGTVVDKIWGTGTGYTLTGAEVTETNVSGSAKTVRFSADEADGSPVTMDVSSATVTSRFGLYSWYFDIDDSLLDPPPPPATEGAATVGVQDPRSGIWTLRYEDGTTTDFYYGNPLDIPFIGDWNGNGIETVGLYRESAGFLFLRYTNDQGNGDVQIYYGNPDDLPVAGDWNGDGTDTIGIYRPSQARFYLRNTNTQGNADVDMAFGNAGDVPIAGDWDGDGIDTVGVYRPSTKMVYLTNSVPGGDVAVSYFYAGAAPGDRIVAGDWNHDGVDTIGVFRPSNTTFYLRDTFTQPSANIVIQLGSSWMNPIAGYWGS